MKAHTVTKFGVVGLMLVSALASATKLLPPLNMRSLAGAWLGPSDSLAYVRLEVNPSGQGLLVIQEDLDGDFSLYRVDATTLSQYDIAFRLAPIKNADSTVRLSGKGYPGRLDLVRSGVNHGYKWQQKIILEREDYLMARIKAVQRASAKLGAKARP